MASTQGQKALWGLLASILFVLFAGASIAAPYAAMVMDARNGKVLHSRNADTRLHPASLTKMMTLYIAFEAVERGEISLDQKVTISRKAASEPPSKLGLKVGQKIAFRYLIRAAAVKSANDAATAIAEAVEGSEAAFARRMNRTAKSLGMTRTTFRNAHGLTETGHLSTARDMTTLGRRLFYDYPEYYNLFSRRSTHAGIREVANTNRKLLARYRGADGIKTGYTRAAGFNLVASAERGHERIIATVFGGNSAASRNARVAELLDLGFSRSPSKVAVILPPRPAYVAGAAPRAAAPAPQRRATVVVKSPIPLPRPRHEPAPAEVAVAVAVDPGADFRASVEKTLALVDLDAATAQPLIDLTSGVGEADDAPAGDVLADPAQGTDAPAMHLAAAVAAAPDPMPVPRVLPRPRPVFLTAASAPAKATEPRPEDVVTRLSTSGGRHFGINVGRFPSRHEAERILLQTALLELGMLDEALRKVVKRSGGFDANFVGMSEEQAALACRRLAARALDCATFGPG